MMGSVPFYLLVFVFLFGDYAGSVSLPEEEIEGERVFSSIPALDEFKQDWGYVNVRPKAYEFWWLFYTTHRDGHENRPLILWLQGGPGGSSTGYGNFEIIGPVGLDLEKRDVTWVTEASLLFVDNPVGTGYSYVTDSNAYTTDVDQVAEDLLTLYKEFLDLHPDFKTVPFYIFGESYGGKMAAAFAERLLEAQRANEITSNLRGFAMSNAWISPEDSTMTWGPLLHWMSVVDTRGLNEIQEAAGSCQAAIRNEQWRLATQKWRQTQWAVMEHGAYVDFYNILQYNTYYRLSANETRYLTEDQVKRLTLQRFKDDDKWFRVLQHPSRAEAELSLEEAMRGPVHKYLGLPDTVVWGGQADMVFYKQEGDFMKPVIDIVDRMIKEGLQVIVYQGQLDLICDTKGVMDWVDKLTWEGLENYNSASRLTLYDPITQQPEVFAKAHDNFKFYWILMAGHAAPKDQGPASIRMLRRIIDEVDK